ncbi:class 3 adenylate cyclase [Flavobacterium sp. 1]|uniref:adenylate/guanylate cyclase domain-containing protein n=1 Tax=Flavobacterium sp. 1 TaxID=2035200 RepID=UPI000CC369D0|nr:adenylate/guanylate cyclase domain-containing protein [Flavobacterium sp. 1]PJJ08111.1 class 3 adenylate cyclase [Flavobacterium sp. 1]
MRRVINIVFSIFLLFNGIPFFGQPNIEQKVIVTNKNIKMADSILNLGMKSQDAGDYSQSLLYFDKSLRIYNSLGKSRKVGDCYSYKAVTYYYQGDYSNALFFFKKSNEEYKKTKYKKGISSILNNIGGVYYYLGNYLNALNYYKQAIVVQEELNDTKMTAATSQNIGGIYSQVEDYSNALKYYDKSYLIYKNSTDVKAISQNLNASAIVYIKLANYPKAQKNLNQALVIADKINDKQLKIEVLSSLGELFFKQSNFERALYYYNLSLKYSTEINSLQYISITEVALGKILNKLNKNKQAITKCLKGYNTAEKIGAISVKKDACDCLYNAYKFIKNDKLALHFYEKSINFKDSLKSEETSNKMMNMEFQRQQLLDSISHVKKEHAVEIKHKEEVQKKETQRNIIIISLCFIVLITLGLWNRLNYTRKSKKALKIEKDLSDELLLNILPEEIAQELKQKGFVSARNFNLVSILFSDFKSFTQTAEKMSPQNLVEEINACFKAFDLITEKYNIEKIKTIGDSYMAAGGIPKPDKESLTNIVLAGLEMQDFMAKRKINNEANNNPAFEMRLGIHAGPIVAGIVGIKKFQYDVWGDTVNTASRIESNGIVGKVNISESLYNLIKNEECFSFEYRGSIQAKGKGELKMYFVEKNSHIPNN